MCQLPVLQKQIAEFKSAARMVRLHSIRVEDEWILNTCYARKNRLLKIAVSNKQAAICGMPVVSAEDAEMLLQTILNLSCLNKKPHAESWTSGELR